MQKKGNTGKTWGQYFGDYNHASILVHLNDGSKQGNDYYEKPHTLVNDLFICQQKHVVKWNQQIYDN